MTILLRGSQAAHRRTRAREPWVRALFPPAANQDPPPVVPIPRPTSARDRVLARAQAGVPGTAQARRFPPEPDGERVPNPAPQQHRDPQPQENEASDDRGRAGGNQRIAGAELIDRDAESDHGDADQDRQNAERHWNEVHAYRGPLPKGWRTLFP